MNLKRLKIPQYEVKGYPIGEENKIQALFFKAYKRHIDIRGIKWQMLDNPCLVQRATSLWDGEKLIAYNALTPAYAIYKGKEIISAVSGTTMADDQYRGVSIQLFTECQNQNQDVDIIYGFPNHNSYRIVIKYLNHHNMGEIAFWTCKARKIYINNSIKKIKRFTDIHGELYKTIARKYEFIKIRNKEYLNWRFFDKPGYDYQVYELIEDGKVKGYIVTDIYMENGIRQLQIIDLIALDDESMYNLLLYAVNLCSEVNCQIVKAWMTSKECAHVFYKAGFEYGEHPFVMTVWDKDIDISNSYITMSDSDIF